MLATPKRLKATTAMPETAPPRKDVKSASLSERLAALAVLMFELTDTYIPMYPERAEKNAPNRKATPVSQLIPIAIRTPRMMLKMAIVLYCRAK